MGQGLPAISVQVLLLLVERGKTREYLTGEQKAELLQAHGSRCALCGQTSHDTRYHTEFQQYVSRRANETTQRQVEAAAAQGLTIPHYNAPRLTAIPPAFPNQYPGQRPAPG